MQKNPHAVLHFDTIFLVKRHKNTNGVKLILMKVARWSAASINLLLFHSILFSVTLQTLEKPRSTTTSYKKCV